MKREAFRPRPGLAQELATLGFRARFDDGAVYWDERIVYTFRRDEIEDDIEKAAEDVHRLCLRLVEATADDPRALARLKIPEWAWGPISESWKRRDPSLYGRFDFAYDGRGPPKLLEYNADTPTSLFEAAVVQWRWLEQNVAAGALPREADQFNSLHEKLIARFRELGDGGPLHLACMKQAPDDAGTLAYLEDCARQAGWETASLDMSQIGERGARFVDPQGRPIRRLFKLYPWEWMWADPFGRSPAMAATRFLEPPWKLILSCKGALAPSLRRYARKPLYSREGADIELLGEGTRLKGPPDNYGAEGFVRQELRPLPEFDGRFPVIGAWIVGEAAAGMGVREDDTPLTTDRARFVPHAIL